MHWGGRQGLDGFVAGVTAEALWIRALLGPWAGRESLGDKKPSLRRTDGGIAELVLGGGAEVGWMACRKMAGRERGPHAKA